MSDSATQLIEGTTLVQLNFTQHSFGFGSTQQFTSSCNMVSLTMLSRFFYRGFYGLTVGEVQSMYKVGGEMMSNFCTKVLLYDPVTGFSPVLGGKELYCRPDEVSGTLHLQPGLLSSELFARVSRMFRSVRLQDSPLVLLGLTLPPYPMA